MNNLVKLTGHQLMGAAFGITSGSLCDAIMPQVGDTRSLCRRDYVMIFGESVAQIMLNALLASSYFNWQRKLGADQDSALGFTYILTTIESQPNLKMKIALLANRLKDALPMNNLSVDSPAGKTGVPQASKPVQTNRQDYRQNPQTANTSRQMSAKYLFE